MKYIYWLLAGLLTLVIGVVGLERLASERVEVVELHTMDEMGEAVTTRLWVVDHEGFQYLRVGADGSGWFSRIQENVEFEVTRDGKRGRYSAVLRQDKSDLINELMLAKYTWGDNAIGLLVGTREGSIPVELHPQTL